MPWRGATAGSEKPKENIVVIKRRSASEFVAATGMRKVQAVKAYGYQNLRYELLAFWAFCCEVDATTWEQALGELVHTCELKAQGAPTSGKRAALYWYRLTPAQQGEVRARLARDIAASEYSGVKYPCPRGHNTAVVKGQA